MLSVTDFLGESITREYSGRVWQEGALCRMILPLADGRIVLLRVSRTGMRDTYQWTPREFLTKIKMGYFRRQAPTFWPDFKVQSSNTSVVRDLVDLYNKLGPKGLQPISKLGEIA